MYSMSCEQNAGIV